MATKPIRKLRVQLMAGVAVVVALVWAAVTYQLDRERESALKLATQQGRNLSSVVADHFSTYAQTVDLLLRRLQLQWRNNPGRFADAVALSEDLRKDASPARIAVFDSGGHLVYSKPPREGPLPVDAEFFAAHRDGTADALRIGNPVKDAESQKTLIYFSRRIVDAKGAFAGAIAVGVSPDPLSRLYEGLELGAKGFVGIRRLHDALRPEFKPFVEPAQRVGRDS